MHKFKVAQIPSCRTVKQIFLHYKLKLYKVYDFWACQTNIAFDCMRVYVVILDHKHILMTELDDSVMDIFTKSVSKDGPEASKVCTVSFLQYLAFSISVFLSTSIIG